MPHDSTFTKQTPSSLGHYEPTTPEYQFRGVWVPAELFHLMGDGTITATELVLCLHIDSLVKSRGLGCFASNHYLAKALNKTSLHISRMIGKLTNMGLVRIVQKHPRLLETTWSRIKGEPSLRIGAEGVCINAYDPYALMHTIHNTNTSNSKKNPRLAAGGSPSLNGHSKITVKHPTINGFETTPKGPQPSQRDYARADRLLDFVKNTLRIGKTFKREKQAQEFRILRKEVHGDSKLVDERLDWYFKHHADQGMPEIRGAREFRRHFHEWLADKYKADQKANPTVEILPEHAEMIKWAKRFNWPKGSGEMVPRVTVISHSNYVKFSKRVFQLIKQVGPQPTTGHYNPGTPQARLRRALQLVKDNMPTINTFADKWMTMVFNQVKNWKEWSADLTHYIFTPSHKLFQKWGWGWAAQNDDRSSWKVFMEAYNADRKS